MSSLIFGYDGDNSVLTGYNSRECAFGASTQHGYGSPTTQEPWKTTVYARYSI